MWLGYMCSAHGNNSDISYSINDAADTWIMDEMFEFLPFATSDDYSFPKYIKHIKIIKDGKIYLFEENQSNEDIKKAQDYIIKYLQEDW